MAIALPNAIPAELERFVFNPDQFLKDDVPRDLEPFQIELLVRTRISVLSSTRDLEQLFKVVDYYDACEVAPLLVKLLTRNEKTPADLQRSAILARLVALVGIPEEWAFARDYFDYLVGKADAYVVQERLVALYEILGPAADPKPLATALANRTTALAREKDKSPQALADYNQAERLQNFTLARAIRANDVKKKILDLKDRDPRLAEEVKMLLAMQYGFGEYLPLFAARRLRRETWAAQPDQQLKRTPTLEGREQVVAALRRALPQIKALALTDGEKQFMTVAAIDAVQFFGGPLSEEEQLLLAGPGSTQKNILSLRTIHGG